MAKNLRIESTDSETECGLAGLQSYRTVSLTIAVAQPPVERDDGSIEHAPEDIQTLSSVVPGRELMQNVSEYDRRVQEFKKQQPNFSELVNQSTEIPLAAHDQILRMRNGPEIALFLSFAPEVCSQLCKMAPAAAAESIEDMGRDLDWGNIPTNRVSYSEWKAMRNREKAPRVRKPKGG